MPNVRPEVLGARLRAARVASDRTQEAAAQAMGMARTTIVAIESGKRSVTNEELRAFAELYNADESDLLSVARPPLELHVQFRAEGRALEGDRLAAAVLLNRLAASVIELEGLIGGHSKIGDLPQISIGRNESIQQQAEDAALSIRQRLGVGLGPISNLATLIEFELGLRVFERPLASRISGAAAFDPQYGGFILLNAYHPPSRRRQTAAHEMCHSFLRRPGVVVSVEGETGEEREDKFCDAFARAFLMPALAVRRKAIELQELSGDLTVRHVLIMAIHFGVAIEAMIRRLEALGICEKGLFESLKDKGLGLKHLEQVKQEVGGESNATEMMPRELLLVGTLYDRELLSEQQIAQKLSLDLVTVRRMLSRVSNGGDRVT